MKRLNVYIKYVNVNIRSAMSSGISQRHVVDLLVGGSGGDGEQLFHVGQYVAQSAVDQMETVVLHRGCMQFFKPVVAEMERFVKYVQFQKYGYDDGYDGKFRRGEHRRFQVVDKIVVGLLIAAVVV